MPNRIYPHLRTSVPLSAGPKSRAAMILVNLGLAILAILFAVFLGGVVLRSAGLGYSWFLRQAISALFKSGEVGIWQEDPVLGWVNIPNSVGQHRKPLVYDVTYHIDERGHRESGGTYDRPKVIILGDSYAFGQGVEDSETFPAELQGRFDTSKDR